MQPLWKGRPLGVARGSLSGPRRRPSCKGPTREEGGGRREKGALGSDTFVRRTVNPGSSVSPYLDAGD